MSQFDPAAYLDATTSEASTRRPPLPVKDFIGTIGEVKSRSGSFQDKKTGEQKSYVALDIPVEIDISSDPELVKVQGTSKVTLTDGLFLDLTPAGLIDYAPGKNNKLRRYREATGQNVAGQPFSPRMLSGRPVRVKIKHEPYEGENYDKIDSVAKV